MTIETPASALPHTLGARALLGDAQKPRGPGWRGLAPGLVVVLLGTLAAGFLSERFGAPLTLASLMVGLALNFLSADKRLTQGLTFASGPLLRWGIVLVGVRITFGQIVALGPEALIAVVCIVALTMGAGVVVARWLGFDTAFGLLAGGSVAICGGSAAMALATTLGDKRIGQSQLTLVLVGISAMSATAMALYPILAHLLHLSDLRAGFLFGASIHDVAQSLGAGYSYSTGAGQIAAIVKLTRVALMAPVLAVIGAFFPRGGERRGVPGLPWFVIGFFVMAGFNSIGALPPIFAVGVERTATGFLAAAVTATGIRSPIGHLLEGGPRPLVVILTATLVALGAGLGAALFFVG
jgi:uncharacterized integral membrane protein (TIGR00698 family)